MLDIIGAVQTYVDTTTSPKSLVQPIVRLHALAEPIEGSIEVSRSHNSLRGAQTAALDSGLWLNSHEDAQFTRLRKSV